MSRQEGVGESPAPRESACAARSIGVQGERFASRDVRRGLQVCVGGFLAVAIVTFAVAVGIGDGTVLPALYAWDNGNDKSRGHRTSVISGMDADDPAFGPSRYRVPPVDRAIAQLKGKPNPEFYDAAHHGPAAQFVNVPPSAPVNSDSFSSASGAWSVVDPDAKDNSQFNINLLLRKSGRMARDASELAGLQKEDEQISSQYEYSKKRAANLLALEGGMKHEMQELSAQQLKIIDELAKNTANQTAESEAAEREAAPKEVKSETGTEGGASSEGGDPDAPSAGDAPAEGAAQGGDLADPDAPDAPSVGEATAGGAEGGEGAQARAREVTLTSERVRAHVGRPDSREVQERRQEPERLLRSTESQRAVRTEGKRVGGDESVAARAARAEQRAATSAGRLGALLKEATHDVQSVTLKEAKRDAARGAAARQKHEQLEDALKQEQVLLHREADLRKQRAQRAQLLLHTEQAEEKQAMKLAVAQQARLQHLMQHHQRHPGPP